MTLNKIEYLLLQMMRLYHELRVYPPRAREASRRLLYNYIDSLLDSDNLEYDVEHIELKFYRLRNECNLFIDA